MEPDVEQIREVKTAKFSVDPYFLSEILFGFTENPVRIHDAFTDVATGAVVLTISGDDVPDAKEVIGVMHTQQNRAGERLRKMTFEGRGGA